MLSLPKKNTTIEIIFEDDNCIMYGLPEESDGCKLKGKVLLTSSKGLKIKNFNFAFIGKTSITCCPFISSTRPECNESHTVCKRECSFPSPPRIPPGIHEFKFEVDLPGHLPSSFKGTRGKIEYWCYVVIERPLFHADISIKKSVTIQRSLLPNDIVTSPITLQDRLSTFTDGILDEKVQYHINAPIMAYREGGLVSIQLSLKPLNSGIIIKSVEYGLKELVHYHKSSSHDVDYSLNNSIKEDRFPLGKKTITFNNDNNILNINLSSSPSSSPSTPSSSSSDLKTIQINFRLCPWVNCDLDSLLITVTHQLSFSIDIEIFQHIIFEEENSNNSLIDNSNDNDNDNDNDNSNSDEISDDDEFNYIDDYINRFRYSSVSCFSNFSSYADSEIRNSFIEPRTRHSLYASASSPLSSPLSVSVPSNIDSRFNRSDYHRRLSFSDAPSQIIHNSNSNSNFHRFSHNDVNFHQSRSMPGSFVNHQILNSIPHNCAESVPNNSITKKTFAHKEQLSLEIPLIVTTKSSYNSYSDRTSMRSSIRNSTHMGYNLGSNNPSNFQDNERSPPYTMVEDPPAYMYAALVPPPPRYNRDS
ncbi:Arrestin domain-containing protein C31A2.12 [Gigaspora margarita]|uniref:Arrestin domain-containing protein C31A2.12 n=1 Tax=Gigaspora margarita TaxID=4874 RepID=A0A8H3WXW5_GIGMA|nr:Arrestin domain-containing protein C31A2.12 [Gigaspora margarita]